MPATAQASIGPSGKTLAVLFVDGLGAPTILKTLSGTVIPTLAVDGGPPVPLTDPMWGKDSLHNPPVPYLECVLYPLDAAVPATAAATLTFPDGTFTTAAGAVAGATVAVATTPADWWSIAVDPAPKTMRVGSNLTHIDYSQPVPIYADLAKSAVSIGPPATGGYPTTGFPITALVTADGPADATDPLNYPGPPAGTWTLKWDGPYTANVGLTAAYATTVTLLTDSPGPGGVANTRTYQVSVNAALRHAPKVTLSIKAPGATKINIYPPGEPTDGSSLFSAPALRMAAGLRCLRFMDPLRANHAGVVDFADFPDPAQFSYYDARSQVGGAVASLDPYTPPVDDDFPFNPNWVAFIVTFKAPHRAQTGQVLTFAGPMATGHSNGTLTTTGGGTSQALWNGQSVVKVLNDTQVATYRLVAGTGLGGTITQSFTQPDGLVFKAKMQYGMPPAHCALLATTVGADCWVNVPHAATDACVAAMAQAILGALGPGLKCYCEHSNEHWNTGLGFEQYEYFNILGRGMPGSGATATATVSGGGVASLTLTSPGSGYQLAPAVFIAKPTSGVQAKAHATLINGVLSLVVDVPGSGYSTGSPPNVTFGAAVNGTPAYVARAAQVHATFKAAFDAAGRGADLVRVMGCQYENPNGPTGTIVTTCVRNGIPFDSLAPAVYYDNTLTGLMGTAEPSATAGFDRLDVEGMHDFSQLAMRHNGYFAPMAAHRALLDAAGFTAVEIACYEGGMQNGCPVGTDRARRSRMWLRHPRMRGLMLSFLQRLQDAGVGLYVDYLLFANIANNTGWAKHFAHGQLDGLGDGSDGLFDNRTDYFDLSKVVSVIGGAMRAFAAGAAPPPPPPPPARHRPRHLPTYRRRQLPRVG